MKNILSLVLIFVFTFTNAQEQTYKLISLTVNTNYPLSFGNNFLGKSYSAKSGFDLAMQFNPTRHLFFGVLKRTYDKTVSNRDLIGDFESATIDSDYFYAGYRHNIKSKNFYMEHYLGYGNKKIEHYSFISSYKIESDNSFLIGSRINFELSSDFSVFGGLDFTYTKYNVNLSGPYRDFYNKSLEFSPTLGLKLSFKDSKKNKNNTN